MTDEHKPELHELLAVEGSKQGIAQKIILEAINTFTKKQDHFLSHDKTLRMFADEDKMQEDAGEEHKAMVTTVPDKIAYAKGAIIEYIDVVFQKECSNQNATADLEVDGITLAATCPATFLLGLETKKLLEIRSMFEAIPTLQPGVEWEKDPQSGENVYKSKYPAKTTKTRKTIQSKILVQPTKEHPAQIDKWTEDVVVGLYTEEKRSGMITPAEKSRYLARIDALLQACKRARMRANKTQATTHKVADRLFEYIMEGK